MCVTQLFGRGKIAKTHTGNLRALHLCEMNYARYESALSGKYGKTEVAEMIVRIIHESGGRFLTPESNGWVEVDDDAAREKISHFFRHMRFKGKNTSNEATPVAGALQSEEDLGVQGAQELRGAKRVTPCSSPCPISV